MLGTEPRAAGREASMPLLCYAATPTSRALPLSLDALNCSRAVQGTTYLNNLVQEFNLPEGSFLVYQEGLNQLPQDTTDPCEVSSVPHTSDMLGIGY